MVITSEIEMAISAIITTIVIITSIRCLSNTLSMLGLEQRRFHRKKRYETDYIKDIVNEIITKDTSTLDTLLEISNYVETNSKEENTISISNCPYCGAPKDGKDKCDYCGLKS